MKRWPTKPLGGLIAIEKGKKAPEVLADQTKTSLRYLQIEDLRPNANLKYCEPFNAPKATKSDVIIAWDGANAGTVSFNLNGHIGSTLAILRPIEAATLSAPFLSRFLEANFRYLQRTATGATIPHVSKGALTALQIPLPALEEQQRIVRLLDEADELRKLRKQADHLTVAFIPAIFHEMFGDPIDNSRGWPLYPVSSFVEELHGGRSVKPAGANEAAGRFRVLKISAVTWGEFQSEESKPVPAVYEPPESHFVRPGDLLFSRANTTELVAATSYVFHTPPNLLLPDKLWRFVWKQPQNIEPLFVWWLFQAPSVRRELGKRATGTGGSMKNISKPKVMSLEVPLPPLPLQNEFAKRVTDIHELTTGQAASRNRLEALFQSILHRAFHGELR